MGKNANLQAAKRAKNDEFITFYEDVESEINNYFEYNNDVFKGKTILLPCDDPEYSNFTKYFIANFERFGLKKLISTSYAMSEHNDKATDFEKNSAEFDEEKHKKHGKVFFMDKFNKNIQLQDNLSFYYLQGDGDFRSEEVTRLRNEADVIITNPPFSLFRQFLKWIQEAKKEFVILGNMNAITYKDVFSLIKDNKLWLGNNSGGTIKGNSMFFMVPDSYESTFIHVENGKKIMQTTGKWFTNIDHGKRHEPLQLMTMEDNLKYNKKLIKKLPKDENGKPYYPEYDNFPGVIEVPVSDGIPSDYNGVMGVPISFLLKYNPDALEIVGLDRYTAPKEVLVGGRLAVKGKSTYARILIRLCK